MLNNYLIIGACGTGKTWIMKQLQDKFGLYNAEQIGLYHYATDLACRDTKIPVVLLGKYDHSMFEGSDRLAMNIMSDNNKMQEIFDRCIVVAEGDRFTNNTYINRFKPIILRITGDGAEGRAKRGSQQTERHTKSIATRINNILPHYEMANSQECYNFIVNELTGGARTAQPYVNNNLTLF